MSGPELSRVWDGPTPEGWRAEVSRRGGQPRRRQIDLAIAATAMTEGVPLVTPNPADDEAPARVPLSGGLR
ncbi:MAG: hypothetical protein WAT13_08275, partial [Candidatus Microthrix parvicella]